jgi:alkaline phosphatase
MRRLIILIVCLAPALFAAKHAKNVILFIGDAGGIPTLNAASIHGHKRPDALFIQHMPHLGLMDTSAANNWVTDSAAAMTAIITGGKTDNGVLSLSPAAPDSRERATLKTLLEYAEENGLSTGLISNSPMTDATPAACYSHVASRNSTGEIFAQFLKPRFGDGPELLIGPGRKDISAATAKLGIDLDPALRAKGYTVYDSPEAVSDGDRRVAALFETTDYDLGAVVDRAVKILSRNRKGFFLMVEWDVHTNNLRRGLDRVLVLDGVIKKTVEQAKKDTLIIFSADHSFDLRVRGGRRDRPLLSAPEEAAGRGNTRSNVRVDDSHTGEQVLVGAQGPGADQVHGFFANTDLFGFMMTAYGWNAAPAR